MIIIIKVTVITISIYEILSEYTFERVHYIVYFFICYCCSSNSTLATNCPFLLNIPESYINEVERNKYRLGILITESLDRL